MNILFKPGNGKQQVSSMLYKRQQMLAQVLLITSKIVIGIYAYHCVKEFFGIRQIIASAWIE
ncbi:hypothetical protein [Pelotomaculum sp. FP]|uniref:hypothetical protein n=1 Tax=Pelotomaculum sp. FP TaxID=261474 RepID=UPI001066BC5C|nr:hypothetical protein [Pelotomaculum sp. FP]